MPIKPGQLKGVTVGRVRFDASAEFPEEDRSNVNYEVRPDVTIGELERCDDGAVEGLVTLAATVEFTRTDGNVAGPVPFDMDVLLYGRFRWESSDVPTDPLARGWLEYNGMYLMWPYLRAYISVVTGLSHFPALTIYTMNVPKPPVIETEEMTPPETDEDASRASVAVEADDEGSVADEEA